MMYRRFQVLRVIEIVDPDDMTQHGWMLAAMDGRFPIGEVCRMTLQ